MDQEPFVEDIETYAQDIVDTVREPLLMLDTTLRVQCANRAFYQTFHVSADETENQLIYELGNGQWDIPDLRTLLEDVDSHELGLQRLRAGAHVPGHRPPGDAAERPQAARRQPLGDHRAGDGRRHGAAAVRGAI